MTKRTTGDDTSRSQRWRGACLSRRLSREVRSPPKNQREQNFYKNKDGSGTGSGGRSENRGGQRRGEGENIIRLNKTGRRREGKEKCKMASTAEMEGGARKEKQERSRPPLSRHRTNPPNERRASKGEESKQLERKKRKKQTHQPIHRLILRKHLIEPRYRCQENYGVHCGNTNISMKETKVRKGGTYHHRRRAPM